MIGSVNLSCFVRRIRGLNKSFQLVTKLKIACVAIAGFIIGRTITLKVKNSFEPSIRADSTREGETEGEGGEEDTGRRKEAVGTVLGTWCLNIMHHLRLYPKHKKQDHKQHYWETEEISIWTIVGNVGNWKGKEIKREISKTKINRYLSSLEDLVCFSHS